MTTEQPYSGDFSVPPQGAAPPTITEDMLPPIPSRPPTVTVAAVLLGLFGLAIVGGNAWEAIAEWTDSTEAARGTGPILLPVLLTLLLGTGAAVLLRLVWLGSKVGSILTIVVAGYMALTFGFVFVDLGGALLRGDLTREVSARYSHDPGAAGAVIAGLTCPPIVLLLAVPPSWRWSRKAGMIRQIRALIRKGRPVTRLPQQIFD